MNEREFSLFTELVPVWRRIERAYRKLPAKAFTMTTVAGAVHIILVILLGSELMKGRSFNAEGHKATAFWNTGRMRRVPPTCSITATTCCKTYRSRDQNYLPLDSYRAV